MLRGRAAAVRAVSIAAIAAGTLSAGLTLKAEPDFDVLRSEVRFQWLLEKLRLVEPHPPAAASPA